VPADAGIEDRCSSGFYLPCKGFCFIEFHSAFDEIERRDAIDDDEIAASGRARAAHDLDREAHAIFERSAPVVLALVGARREELRK
jgi:hypothetical protein